MFEFVEAAFDAIALLVQFSVVGPLELAIAFRRNYGPRTDVLRLRHQSVGVVASVGDHRFRAPAAQQLCRWGILTGLACGDAKLQRQAILVGQQVDLRAQTSSGTPQSLVFAPFLRPVAACWCARTIVESIIRYWFFLS